jgi:hypothetical protein|tara:strand:- start:922 stop:1152 length:231 start_codon:yes stop_codon:yes gene_type:complete
MNESSRSRTIERVEEVVYTKQKIKHFDRNGSEFWQETNVPDLVEKEVKLDSVVYVCAICGETQTVTEELTEPSNVP